MSASESSNFGKTVAYFASGHEFIEEIIIAAHLSPYKILGDVHQPTEPADQYLAAFFCPLARSIMTEALLNPNKWAGIVIAHGCNTTNRHYDIWQRHVQTPFLTWMYNPIKNYETPSTRKFFRKEIQRFLSNIENHFHIHVSKDALTEAIHISNWIKQTLTDLARLRLTNDIPNEWYYEILRATVQMPKETVISTLKTALDQWKSQSTFPPKKKRIFLTGTDITYREWMDLLEECNLRVVRDDLSLGERYYISQIREDLDPLDALTEYYLTLPKAATRLSINERIEYILNSFHDSSPSTPIAGVISQNLKFCEPYALDSVSVVAALKQKNIPVIHLEREYGSNIDQQLKTRLEAFFELL